MHEPFLGSRMVNYDAVPVPAALRWSIIIFAKSIFLGLAFNEPDVTAGVLARIRNWSNWGDRRNRHWQISPAYLRHGTVDVWRDAKAGHCGLLEPH